MQLNIFSFKTSVIPVENELNLVLNGSCLRFIQVFAGYSFFL